MNESCHSYEYLMPLIWMRHATHRNASSNRQCSKRASAPHKSFYVYTLCIYVAVLHDRVRIAMLCSQAFMYICVAVCCSVLQCVAVYMYMCTANATWGDIFEWCFKAQSSELQRLFSLKRGNRDVGALSFELSKMTPQVGLAVCMYICIYVYM